MNAFLLPLVAAFAVQGGEVSDKGISTWFAPSTVKVMRDAKPDGAAATWNLAAARNELESCQLVLKQANAEGVQGGSFRGAAG
jgi:hypothetical protein